MIFRGDVRLVVHSKNWSVRGFTAFIVAVAISGCDSSGAKFQAEGTQLHTYSGEFLDEVVAVLWPEHTDGSRQIYRGPDGASVRIWVRDLESKVERQWWVDLEGEIAEIHHDNALVNPAGEKLVWQDEEKGDWVFANGDRRERFNETREGVGGIVYNHSGVFDFDPDFEVFVVEIDSMKYEVCRIADPLRPLVTLDGWLVYDVFAVGDDIILFGKSARGSRDIHFEVYARDGGAYVLEREGTLDGPDKKFQDGLSLVDISPCGSYAVCHAGVTGAFGKLADSWYIYDLDTGQRVKSLGASGAALFLQDDILRNLKRRLQ